MKASPHLFPESALTGSTLAAMVKRSADLGRTHFTCGDSGHMGSCMKAYGMAKKSKLKPILGISFFFKDPKCGFTVGTAADRCKYFSSAIYAMDQEAYQELCRVVSKTDLPEIEVFDEPQNLWSWAEIERMSGFQTQFVCGGIHDMVGKCVLAGTPDVAEKVLLRLKELFGDRLSLAIMCEPWTSKFTKVIKIDYIDGTHDSLLATDTVSTDKARKIKAVDLITRSGHKEIVSKITGSTFFEVGKKIKEVTEHTGFLPLPGGDASLRVNQFFLEMGKKHGINLLVTDYAFYAEKSDKIVQTMTLEGKTKFRSNLHMKTDEEIYAYLYQTLGVSQEEAVSFVENTDRWASNFDGFELKYEWRLADSGGNPLQKCMDIIKKNGRMKWDNKEYVDRLKEEITVIAKNGVKDFSAYFLPIYDVVNHYKENGRLTGPSRGSAGGSLFCYLMGITQVDPIRYGLSFPRFLSLDRIKNGDIPDVDTDFPDRDLLVGKDGKSGYLYQRWGNKAAQISTRHMIRVKSAIKDTARYFHGSVSRDIEAFSKSLPNAPQGVPDRDFVFGYEDTDGNHNLGLIEINDALKSYASSRPEEWDVVQKALGIPRSKSRHASAFCISDIPLTDILPTKDGHITQYEAKAVESCGILKYDFLTVSNIKDVEVCLNLINEKNKEKHTIGYFTHNGNLQYIWDLPEDLDVYKSCWDGETTSLFQINSKNMSDTTKAIMPKSVEDGSTILALERPGPKDFVDPNTGKNMVQEYIDRRNGISQPDLKELYDLIPETYGIICYQEQSLKISKELGGMSPSDAEKLRRLFSKKQKKEVGEMKPIFMSTAIPKIGEEKANKIWDMMETSSRYSFNKSHSTGYFLITYAGLYLRHHYPLEWWAAILTNAEEKEITGVLWPHVRHLLAAPDINLSSDRMEIDYANGKIRAKLGIIRGMGDKSIDPIVAGRPYKDIQDFVDKEVAGPALSRKLIHVGVLDSLFPAKFELLQKMQMFEDALELKKYKAKPPKPLKDGTVPPPKKGVIGDEYLTIENDPMRNAAIRKSILPSLLVGLNDLGKNYSKCIKNHPKPSKLMSYVDEWGNEQEAILITGEMLQRLEEPTSIVNKDIIVAVTAFIISTEVRDYAKNTKQMLKVNMDVDGFTKEFVMWPDFKTNELLYPSDLKKGNICTIFLKKRANKEGSCNIVSIVIEA